MQSAEDDLIFLQGGLDILESYLLSHDLYWSMNVQPGLGSPSYPEFSMGSLLLTWKRLQARTLSNEQQARRDHLFMQLEAIHTKWQVAWESKAAHSFQARLKMWNNYLMEYRDAPNEHADRYAYEVRLRVMLELLEKDSRDIAPHLVDLLKKLDQMLKAILVVGQFIWDAELQKGFGAEQYWFLYGHLREELR